MTKGEPVKVLLFSVCGDKWYDTCNMHYPRQIQFKKIQGKAYPSNVPLCESMSVADDLKLAEKQLAHAAHVRATTEQQREEDFYAMVEEIGIDATMRHYYGSDASE